jgi:hypothetical protein
MTGTPHGQPASATPSASHAAVAAAPPEPMSMTELLACKNPFTGRVAVDGALQRRPLSFDENRRAFVDAGVADAWVLKEDTRGCFDLPKDFEPKDAQHVSIVFEPLDCSRLVFVGPCRHLTVVSIIEKH